MDKDTKLANKAKFAMKFGSDAHQERVLKKGIKATAVVRWDAAINGPKHHLDILVHDRDPEVRSAVACQGHEDHLNKLVSDKDPIVRAKVAYVSGDKHRDILKTDKDPIVRRAVAANTYNKQHLEHLMQDEDPMTKTTATNRYHRGLYD